MKIKVKYPESLEIPVITYPYLGISNERTNYPIIVYFISPRTGVVINDGDKVSKVGYFATTWNEESFKYFYGEVTLSN